MKKSLHSYQLIDILFKIKYNLEDSFECYDFLKEDLSAEGEVKQTVQAFLKQVGLLKNTNKFVKQQIFLVQVANASPYG